MSAWGRAGIERGIDPLMKANYFLSAPTAEAGVARLREIREDAPSASPVKPRRYQPVFVRWVPGYAYEVRFIGWRRIRKGSGKLYVGALVDSTWLFEASIIGAVPAGCKRGQYILGPRMPIFATYDDAKANRNRLPRPKLTAVKPKRK